MRGQAPRPCPSCATPMRVLVSVHHCPKCHHRELFPARRSDSADRSPDRSPDRRRPTA